MDTISYTTEWDVRVGSRPRHLAHRVRRVSLLLILGSIGFLGADAATGPLAAQALSPDARVESDAEAAGAAHNGPLAEPLRELPFGIGEELVYDVTSSRLGRIGEGAMRVEGPEAVRGRSAYRLSFEIDSRVGPVRVRDETRSWLEPEAMRSLRYSKRERHPLARRSEKVEIFPEDRRWVAEGGEAGRSSVDDPLDELSFLYFIRTLELDDDAEYVIERHFDPARNPVVVRVLGRERASLPSGLFDIVVVEMEVRDGERFEETGLLRLYLTDDSARFPVRIVTSVPLAGELVLDLKALTPGVALAGARDTDERGTSARDASARDASARDASARDADRTRL